MSDVEADGRCVPGVGCLWLGASGWRGAVVGGCGGAPGVAEPGVALAGVSCPPWGVPGTAGAEPRREEEPGREELP